MEKRLELIKLPDRRQLSYQELGDPKGVPIIYFHGLPGSRIEGNAADAVARDLKVRVIAIDRPGFGYSTYQSDRTILGFADDVLEVTDQLKINNFGVLAVSGGAPYALGCAFRSPERVASVGIVSGMVPMSDEVYSLLRRDIRFFLKLSRRETIAPVLLSAFDYLTTHSSKLNAYLRRRTFCLADLETLSDPQRSELLKLNKQEALRQGAKGTVKEMNLLRAPWGFDLAEVKSLVKIWHGSADPTVPLEACRYLQSKLVNKQVRVFPDEGHYMIFNHLPEIVEAIKF